MVFEGNTLEALLGGSQISNISLIFGLNVPFPSTIFLRDIPEHLLKISNIPQGFRCNVLHKYP